MSRGLMLQRMLLSSSALLWVLLACCSASMPLLHSAVYTTPHLDEGSDLGMLALGHDRPQAALLIQRVADLDGLGALLQARVELVRNALLHQQPRGGAADLTVRPEAAELRAATCASEAVPRQPFMIPQALMIVGAKRTLFQCWVASPYQGCKAACAPWPTPRRRLHWRRRTR